MIKKTVGADIIRPKKGFPEGSLPLEGKVSAKQTDEVFLRLPPSELPPLEGTVAKPKVLTDEGKTLSNLK